ncbi:MAG: 1,2-diacylglycerol 3-glucosyltransferase [Candidatus Magasanikbacteria bacterium]|nr:1,2-diacylglycerol 3-glucosyltransferase [Candidatus Magasanikbacteria bacterium]
MNIGIFTDTYNPQINGVVVSIETYRAELERLGHQVYIFAPNEKIKYEARLEKRLWLFPSVPFYGQKEYRLAYWPRLKKEFLSLPLDIVHTQTPFTLGRLGVRLARARGLSLVHTYHTHYEEYVHYAHLPRAATKTAARLLAKKFLNVHTAIIAPSTEIKTTLKNYGVVRPINVLPTGVDLKKICRMGESGGGDDWLKNFGIAAGDFLVATTSRLGREKNIEFLLAAVALVKKQNCPIKFLLIGDGPEKNHLREAARRAGLGNDVFFAGYLNHGEIFSLYRKVKLFLFASKTETQGLVIIEALASGVPAVAVTGNGTADILAKNRGGFLTNEDTDEFAEKILALWRNPKLWQNKSLEAAARAQDYSISDQTAKLLSLYERLIQQS